MTNTQILLIIIAVIIVNPFVPIIYEALRAYLFQGWGKDGE